MSTAPIATTALDTLNPTYVTVKRRDREAVALAGVGFVEWRADTPGLTVTYVDGSSEVITDATRVSEVYAQSDREVTTSHGVRFRPDFTTPFDQHKDRAGEPFRVIERRDATTHPHFIDPEVGYLWRIAFYDGEQTDAFPDEVEVPARQPMTVRDLIAALTNLNPDARVDVLAAESCDDAPHVETQLLGVMSSHHEGEDGDPYVELYVETTGACCWTTPAEQADAGADR